MNALFKIVILFDIEVTWAPLESFGRKKVQNPTIHYLWVCALFLFLCIALCFILFTC